MVIVRVGDVEVTQEEFGALDFNEKWGMLGEAMNFTVKLITDLARQISTQEEERQRFEGRVRGVAKSVGVLVTQHELMKDILKGKSRGFLDKQFWMKEESKLKKYVERLSYVI